MIALPHRPVNGMEDGFTVANVRDVAKFERGSSRSHRELEHWSGGILEYWSIGVMGSVSQQSSIPSLQHSINPILHSYLLPEPREDLFSIFVKNLLLLFRRQPRNAFDVRPHVVVPLAGARIGL